MLSCNTLYLYKEDSVQKLFQGPKGIPPWTLTIISAVWWSEEFALMWFLRKITEKSVGLCTSSDVGCHLQISSASGRSRLFLQSTASADKRVNSLTHSYYLKCNQHWIHKFNRWQLWYLSKWRCFQSNSGNVTTKDSAGGNCLLWKHVDY